MGAVAEDWMEATDKRLPPGYAPVAFAGPAAAGPTAVTRPLQPQPPVGL